MRVGIRFLLSVILYLIAHVSYALDKTETGFFYPTGTANFDQKCGTWLSRDNAHGGCYEDGYYHVGVDIMHPFDEDVYAISDGEVVATSYDDGTGNKWGFGNCALVVEHRKSDLSGVFVVVYGHLQCSTLKLDIVAGRSLGKIGHWKWGDHLHFAIHDGPYSTMAKSGWGRVPNSSWPSQNTFTDPIAFIQTNTPVSSRCVGTVCGDIALYPAKLSQARQVRFGASTYSVTDVGWWPIVAIKCEAATQHYYLIPKQEGNVTVFSAVPAPRDVCDYVIQPTCGQ